MKKLIIFLFAFSILLISCTKNLYNQEDKKVEQIAENFMNEFFNEEYDNILKGYKYNKVMKKELTKNLLITSNENLNNTYGQFIKKEDMQQLDRDSYRIVKIYCELEKGFIYFNIIFDKNKAISGFNIEPVSSGISSNENDDEHINEVEYIFGKEGFELPATLTIPTNVDSYPVLILVHGSGPNDRDETVGPNKPFKDISIELAKEGIGVFRYDKRTKVHGDKIINIDEFTLYDETIEDCIYAFDFIKNNSNINASKIFILGHSLGGYAIPKIAKEIKEADGFIIAAGPVRNMEDLLVEQYEYICGLDEKITDEEQNAINELKKVQRSIKTINKGNTYTVEELMGVGKEYWLDLKNYKPAEEAKNIKKPLFIIQGDRDYQVTLVDYNMWINALENNKNVTFKLYEGINHLLMKGKGEPNPKEYNVKNTVDIEIINDIICWIKDNCFL
jgi:dienelactone hydrolase